MTLVIQRPPVGSLQFRKTWQPMDPDAAAYITAVEAADAAAGQSGGLEEKVKIAIDNFVLGCKADGIWTAIKACCILAGARTLAGALVPLVGPAPTSFNFVNADYNRKTGLVGDGSTKYLNSNRSGNIDPQNRCHGAVFVNTALTVTSGAYFGSRDNISGQNRNSVIVSRSNGASFLNFSARSGFNTHNLATDISLIGVSRSNSTDESARSGGITVNYIANSLLPGPNPIFIFAQNTFGTVNNFVDARISYYSIGEDLNLSRLDARITGLMNDLASAIP